MTTAPIDQQFAQDLVDRARAEGVDLTGPGGLLTGLTKQVLETALETELGEHLGYDKHDPAERNRENSRNGNVPRDRGGSFEPVIVKKRQRRLSGIDNAVLALTARGLTTGELEAFFDETYGVHLGKDTISRITEKVIEEMTDWCHRPLDAVYPVVFIDCVHVKIRDGQVVNRPIYVALAVTTNGDREILGLLGRRRQRGCEVLARGARRDPQPWRRGRVHRGLRRAQGLPDAINTVWPQAIVQACVLHLIRNSFHYAGRHDCDKISKDLRPVYQAVNADPAAAAFEEFEQKWGQRYPAIVRLWRNAWAEFVPFLDYHVNRGLLFGLCEGSIGRLRACRGRPRSVLPVSAGRPPGAVPTETVWVAASSTIAGSRSPGLSSPALICSRSWAAITS